MSEIKKFVYPPTGIEHRGKLIDSKDGFDVIECNACGFKHIIPLPDSQQYERYYRDYFYQNKESYIKCHTEDLEWWMIEHDEKIDFFDKQFSSSSSKKILDIGSGDGYFLKAGRERGWEVVGIEPGKPAYLFSTKELGLNVFNELFSKTNYKKWGTFDVIHMNNVLEHIVNPYELLKLAHEILNPQGLICVTSPNDYNPFQKVIITYLMKDPWWISPQEHINYFNHESLTKMLNKVGFDEIFATSSFPLELFVLMGEDYIGNRKLGREIHIKRKCFDLAMEKSGNTKLRREIYKKFTELELGREITVIGRKKYKEEVLNVHN